MSHKKELLRSLWVSKDPFLKILEANRERISTKIPGQA